jgi:hypothetical protein
MPQRGEYLTGEGLGKRSRLLFAFKIDATDICAWNLPEADGLEFHVIEPGSHLAQLKSQVSADRYFNNIEH